VLLNRAQAKLHLGVAIPTALLTLVCLTFYVRESLEAGEPVGGGSGSGLICGIVAGLVIIFEMGLWPRKALRRLRLFPTKYWLAAHIWLGLASLPLAIAHSGFHLGGWLPATFMVLFVLCILSGVYGLIVQNVIPRYMLRNLPSETIYNQIDYVSKQTVKDARQMLVTACGRDLSGDRALQEEPELQGVSTQTIVIGAVRQAGRTRGRTLETQRVAPAQQDRETLWTALSELEPFLLHGEATQTPVNDRQQAAQWFSRLRSACSEDGQSVIDILESMCDQRRQFDVQVTLHRWLHTWLAIHVGLSVAVTVLLAAHVWTALKYW
jgi:hypothetical protein